MNICIEARALSMRGGGTRTYVSQLLKHLLRLYPEEEFHVLHDHPLATPLAPPAQQHLLPLRSRAHFPFWLHYSVVKKIRSLQPDVVHFTKADVPIRKTVPTIVTIYDVIPLLIPATQPRLLQLYWRGALRRAVKHSHYLITISQASKHDIVRLLGVDPDRIAVTPLAADARHFHPIEDRAVVQHLRKKYNLSHPYVLFVGQHDYKKNIPSLIRSFAMIAKDIPHHLVIAGKKSSYTSSFSTVARQYSVTDRLHILDYVAYEDLPALYSGADLLAWPSIYEGWGFPVQEAMACGTAVLVSNGGSIPEVVGEAGEVVPFTTDDFTKRLHDEAFMENFANRMRELLLNAAFLESRAQAGRQHVRKYTWENVARKTFEVYGKAIGN